MKNIDEELAVNPITFIKGNDNYRNKSMLRLAIQAEYDAINLYEQMAKVTKNKKLKKIFMNVAEEEKIHIGEFEAMLKKLDKKFNNALIKGKKEI